MLYHVQIPHMRLKKKVRYTRALIHGIRPNSGQFFVRYNRVFVITEFAISELFYTWFICKPTKYSENVR